MESLKTITSYRADYIIISNSIDIQMFKIIIIMYLLIETWLMVPTK